MTAEEQSLLNNILTRVRQLMLQDKRLQQRCATLEQQVEQRQERIVRLEQQLKEAGEQYATLKIAKTMELTEADQRAAHRRLNSLVRQVDECIALLQAK